MSNIRVDAQNFPADRPSLTGQEVRNLACIAPSLTLLTEDASGGIRVIGALDTVPTDGTISLFTSECPDPHCECQPYRNPDLWDWEHPLSREEADAMIQALIITPGTPHIDTSYPDDE